MAFTGCHFNTRDDVERVMSPVCVSPQTGIQYIVIGNRNYIQATPLFDIAQHLLDSTQPVAGFGVHVDIGAPGELLYFQDLYAPSSFFMLIAPLSYT